MSTVHVRWMIRRDMDEVLAIERTSFDQPWSEEDFIKCLRQRNCIGMVCELHEQVVGFMLYELHRTRLNILNIAVHPTFRRDGIGKQMIVKLWSKMNDRRTRLSAHVRETNLAAQLFFKATGFRAVAINRGFYQDSDELAYTFERRMKQLQENAQ